MDCGQSNHQILKLDLFDAEYPVIRSNNIQCCLCPGATESKLSRARARERRKTPCDSWSFSIQWRRCRFTIAGYSATKAIRVFSYGPLAMVVFHTHTPNISLLPDLPTNPTSAAHMKLKKLLNPTPHQCAKLGCPCVTFFSRIWTLGYVFAIWPCMQQQQQFLGSLHLNWQLPKIAVADLAAES